MRNRLLDPGFFENEELAELGAEAQILFAGLWCYADREGRFKWKPQIIKGRIFPFTQCDVPQLLDSLALAGFIVRYNVNGKEYGQVLNFLKYQRIHPREMQSKLPAYEEAFLSNFSEEVIIKKTGKRGRPRKKPLKEVDPALKLAQTHKYRKNGKVINVTEEIIYGDENEIRNILEKSSVSNYINTSFVERNNGTVRSKVSRTVRCTYSFSKKYEKHIEHLIIYFLYYNFIWIHSRLKKTAASLAGIVNKAFTFNDLFSIRSLEFICGY